MKLSMLTVLEIFTNPDDLEITVEQEKKSAKFSIGIFRGPRHNFKPMLTSRPFTESQEDAIKSIKKIFQTVYNVAIKEFEDKESFAFQYFKHDNQKIDQSKVLNQDMITRILDELRQHRVVSTHKMFATIS